MEMRTQYTLLYILWLVLLPLAAPAQDFAGDEIEVSPSGGFLQSTSMNARGDVLVVWANDAIRGRLLAPDDTPLGPEFQISERTSDYILALSGAIDLQGFSVVWDQAKRFSHSSWMRRFDAAGEPVTERQGVGVYPTVGTDPRGGSVVVGYELGSLLGRRFDAAGKQLGRPAVLAVPRAVLPPLQVVVDDRGSFVVVWKNAKRELLGRRFTNGGQPRGPAFRIARSVEHFDLAGNGKGGFVALWTTPPRGLWAQAFTPSGAAFPPVLVAPQLTDQQTSKVSVAMDAAGRFLATWDCCTDDVAVPYRVFGRFFEASGAPLDSLFQVDLPTTSYDYAPDAAGGAAGQFFVTWLRKPDENGLTRVIGRRLRWPGRP
jgi:hypothetical protein